MTLKNSGKEQQSVCTEPKKKCGWFLALTSGCLPASEELWKSIMLLKGLKIVLRE
jgi:hypothetical protein